MPLAARSATCSSSQAKKRIQGCAVELVAIAKAGKLHPVLDYLGKRNWAAVEPHASVRNPTAWATPEGAKVGSQWAIGRCAAHPLQQTFRLCHHDAI
ncbi:MAG: hypothetical protein VX601_00350 [Pseudomonadota bacterium]|nr:hypothetical protein [Pseudomonadota bacterium]